MIRADKIQLMEVMDTMFALIHTKCEIATLTAKNQNAPKYLYEQALSLQAKIQLGIAEISE